MLAEVFIGKIIRHKGVGRRTETGGEWKGDSGLMITVREDHSCDDLAVLRLQCGDCKLNISFIARTFIFNFQVICFHKISQHKSAVLMDIVITHWNVIVQNI